MKNLGEKRKIINKFLKSEKGCLWVDTKDGSDENDGLSPYKPLKTIQKAIDKGGLEKNIICR